MAITATTLSSACAVTDTSIAVTSATGITAPVNPTGSGFTYLYIDNELVFVLTVAGTLIGVLRGQNGTKQVSHATSTPVLIGGPSDFPGFAPTRTDIAVAPSLYSQVSAPFTGATIVPALGVAYAHFTGTTALVTITPPAGLVQGGSLTLVNDGSGSGLTWTAAGNIAVAGTFTTAASSVTFVWDASLSTPKWIPSRLA